MGGVDLTSSDSLVGVKKTTFDDDSLAIGRRDIHERAAPREAATGVVDLTGSVGLIDVDKMIFEDEFLATAATIPRSELGRARRRRASV